MRALSIATALLLVACSLGWSQSRPVIGVAGIAHESNSFNVTPTRLEDFSPAIGEESREAFIRNREAARTTVSGYIEGAKRFDLDLYPTLVTSATPAGPVTDDAFNTMTAEILKQLKAAPKLDGILLALHGAMVVESYPSGDAEITHRVREAFGPDMPIIVTHDFHANVTPDIIRDSNVLITYKENPHIDTFERGIQAAEIMAKMVRGEVHPTQTLVKPPMVYNIVFQHTKSKPLLPIVDASKALEKNPKVLAVSVSGGYQYADVEWMGPTAVVVTDNDPDMAEREAKRLSDMLWATRDDIILREPSPAQAVKMAMEDKGRPIVLIDMGDNIGGGTPGDSTFLLDELLKQKAQGWVMVIADPPAFAVAEKAGVGGAFDMEVGGKTDSMHGKPVRVKGEVRSLHIGRYLETERRHGGGRYWNMGKTAVIQVEGSTLDEPNLLLLTTERSSPNSAHQLISNGVYVERQKIIVVKGAVAPRAAYEPIAARLIPVDSPGATAVNPAHFDFNHVRPGLFGMGKE
ncbi:MAG: M81 family metallopeptidase [Acidobacteria bacterium]|nr:M81 family metallopeptidase [Acidobacteriota bacterium]